MDVSDQVTAQFRWDAEAIERARLEKGLTKEELAERTGLSGVTIGRLCRTGRASPKSMRKIAKALGLAMKGLVVRADEAAEAAEVTA